MGWPRFHCWSFGLILGVGVTVDAGALGQVPLPAPGGVAPVLAPGGPEDEAAKALFYEGLTLMSAGDYRGGLDRFLRSRALAPKDLNTRNAAICFESLGRFDEALNMYEELLQEYGTKLEPEDRRAIEEKVAYLIEHSASIDIRLTSIGRVLVDGGARGTLPLRRPLRVGPGPHLVTVVQEGRPPFEIAVEVGAGGSVILVIDAVPEAPLRPQPDDQHDVPENGAQTKVEEDTPTWAWAAGATGIVLLGVATGFGLDGLDAQRVLEDHCSQDLTCEGYDPTAENARKNRGLGVFLGASALGVAGVAVGISGLMSTDAGGTIGRWVLRPAVAEGGGGVLARHVW